VSRRDTSIHTHIDIHIKKGFPKENLAGLTKQDFNGQICFPSTCQKYRLENVTINLPETWLNITCTLDIFVLSFHTADNNNPEHSVKLH